MKLRPRHPGLLLVALLLAVLVWYINALDRRERVSERQLDTPLTLVNISTDLVVTSEVPRFLNLRVRGPLNRLRSLDPTQTGVVIDLRTRGEGVAEVAVESRSVVVPSGIEVLAVSPAQLALRLERMVRHRLTITPRTVGDVAPGMEIGLILVDPPTALVSGPRLQLEALKQVLTDPVTVEGASSPVEMVVAIHSPHPLVRIIEPPTARVTVEVRPRPSGLLRGKKT